MRPNRTLVVLLSVVAMFAGLAPAALVAGRSWLIPYIALGALIVAIPSARVIRSPSPVRPTVPEVLIVTLNAAALPALLGLFWLLVRLLLLWAIRFLAHLTDSSLNAPFIASAASITLLAVVAALLTWFTTGEVGAALYPTDEMEHTRYYVFATHPRALRYALGTAIAIVVLVILATILFGPDGAVVWLVLLVAVPIWGIAYEPEVAPPSPYERVSPEEVQRIGLALAGDTYAFVSYPLTSEPEVDPLLAEADLFVYNDERAYVVEIKRPRAEASALSWSVGTTVLNAARALAGTSSLGIDTEVWPLLVILGGSVDDTLRRFCADQRISLVCLDRITGRSEVAGPDTPALEEFARRFLDAYGSRARSHRVWSRLRRREGDV